MGYVYFIRHKRMSPIKIGMTESEDVNKRVSSFVTASPFGIELIGYIFTTDPKALESFLHKKYRHFRLEGEWFDIPIIEVESIIENYHYKIDPRKFIYLDIPFEFDWTKYSIKQMEIFRCFFYFLEIDEKEFDYMRIKKLALKHTKVPERELTSHNLKFMHDKYFNIMNGQNIL